jgi:threonine/homoserine/homoserine lactone efflux protein
MQTSATAFWIVKLIGAVYLIWLGIKVLRSRSLVSFAHAHKQPLRVIFSTGFLSAALNPKPGLFILAFLPQFVSPDRGSVTVQMVAYGIWFAVLTGCGFALMGVFASTLASWLKGRPRFIFGLNVCAGVTFLASGVSIAALKQR